VDLRLIGELTIRHIRDGKVLYEETLRNLIVTAGKAGVAGLLIATDVTDHFTYLAIGTGTTAPAAGDTTLEAELSAGGMERAVADTLSRVTTTVTNDTAQLVIEWTKTSAGTTTVTEAGILNAAAAGDLLARQTFTGIALEQNDKLSITWKVQVATS